MEVYIRCCPTNVVEMICGIISEMSTKRIVWLPTRFLSLPEPTLHLGCNSAGGRGTAEPKRYTFGVYFPRDNFQSPPRDAFHFIGLLTMASNPSASVDKIIELTDSEEEENTNSEEDESEIGICVRDTSCAPLSKQHYSFVEESPISL